MANKIKLMDLLNSMFFDKHMITNLSLFLLLKWIKIF